MLKRQNDRANRVIKNFLTIFLMCFGPNMSNEVLIISVYSKMYNKVAKQNYILMIHLD